MAMPEQIRKQAAAVQDHYKQIGEPANTEGEAVEVAETPVVEAADQQQNHATQSVEGEQSATDNKPSDDGLLQKYRTLQGMYNAEVPRLHAQNKDLTARVAQLEQLLATMSAAPAQQQETAPQSRKVVTQADIDEYGDSIDVMRRVYQEEVGNLHGEISQLKSYIQQMQTNVVPQVQAVAQRQAATAEQQFWADLTSAVPSWQSINNDQDFHSWLLETDPLTGIARQTYLEDAQRALDSRRVANFFRTWLEVSGRAAVAQPNRTAAASELEKQVAPGRPKSGGSVASNKTKTYSPEDIKSFFNDVRSGKYKGRETERDRIERDIFAAQREGRITA